MVYLETTFDTDEQADIFIEGYCREYHPCGYGTSCRKVVQLDGKVLVKISRGITTMTTDERITILKDAIMGLVEVCRVMNEQGAKQDKRIADLESREALNTFNWL